LALVASCTDPQPAVNRVQPSVVQEDFLIARRTYQYISGSEIQGLAGDTETGAAIAMWRIQSHFDVAQRLEGPGKLSFTGTSATTCAWTGPRT